MNSMKLMLSLGLTTALAVCTAEAKAGKWLQALGITQQPAAAQPAAQPAAAQPGLLQQALGVQQPAPAAVAPAAAVPAAPAAVAVPQPALSAEEQQYVQNGQPIPFSMDDLAKRLRKNKGLLVVDVRSPGEFRSGHIPGAINIPVDEVTETLSSRYPDHNQAVYVYCLSGGRASSAARALVAQGYRCVYNCGGINDWDGKLSKGK